MYISIPSITGKDPTPGYPGAMNVRSLTIAPDGFTMIKDVDTASAQITAAIVGGTPLHTATALLYNSTPSGSPDATLALQNIFGSSYTFLGGTPELEQDQFNSTSPAYLYLDVPGITGVSSTPGYPAVMRIQSFTLNANDFSVVKEVDSASPQIASAIVGATLFPTFNLLLYNSTPTGPPDAILSFRDVLASSYTSLSGGGDIRMEQDDFDFASISQPTPEPDGSLLTIIVVSSFGIAMRRRTCGDSTGNIQTVWYRSNEGRAHTAHPIAH